MARYSLKYAASTVIYQPTSQPGLQPATIDCHILQLVANDINTVVYRAVSSLNRQVVGLNS